MTANWLAVRARTVSGVLVMLIGLVPLAAGAAEHCARLSDPVSRLACYDAAYPVRAPVAAAEALPAAPDAATAAAANRSLNVVDPAPASPASPAAPSASNRFGLPPENPLAAADDVDQLESTVVAIRKQARKNTVYRLANGQVWIQTAPREVTIDEGDHVTIRRGMLGGYMLRNRDGASTRVGRVR